MSERKPESELVRLVMPEASDQERDEATWRWFTFIQVLNRIVRRSEREAQDSLEMRVDGKVEATQKRI